MRRLTSIIAILMLLCTASCMRAVRTPDRIDRTATNPIFNEAADRPIEIGQLDLILRLSIKTHPSNYYLLESNASLHGKPGYPFIVTIDGQSIVWREDGQIEKTPEYDAKGIRTPEGGDGRRYVFERRLRLGPGNHRIEVALPEEPYAYATNVTLEQRSTPYLLEFKPVYRRSTQHRPSFLHGLARLEPFLDNRYIGP